MVTENQGKYNAQDGEPACDKLQAGSPYFPSTLSTYPSPCKKLKTSPIPLCDPLLLLRPFGRLYRPSHVAGIHSVSSTQSTNHQATYRSHSTYLLRPHLSCNGPSHQGYNTGHS